MLDFDQIRIRAKQAPIAIYTAREALEALSRVAEYRSAAKRATWKAGTYTNGVASWERNHIRADKYEDMADAWQRAINDWFSRLIAAEDRAAADNTVDAKQLTNELNRG